MIVIVLNETNGEIYSKKHPNTIVNVTSLVKMDW